MMAVIALLGVGMLLKWNLGPTGHRGAPDGMSALHFETRHGEQLTQRLVDNTVLHLNTDSAVSIRYSKSERLVTLTLGQASFEVAHEADRGFRVRAGSADITDLGTRFDVRLDGHSTVVTVLEGRVAVGPRTSGQTGSPRPVELHADQQVRVADGTWPATAIAVDAKRTTAWLHRQIVFDNEPLEQVAAEYNRYTAKPIEIATPALRKLRISGVFASDDADAFIAFLRSLKGVRVEVTATRIVVSKE
jgi:transmembrane sensor